MSMGTPHVIRPEGGRATQQLLALFDSHVRDLYSFLFRRCGDAALAEDLTQEVFVEAARRTHVSAEVPTRAWLYQSARHRLIDHWRRESRGSIKLRLVGATDADERVGDPADQVTTSEHLMTALGELSREHRAALVLRYVDDLTVEQVADALGRSVRATESLLTRARQSFGESYREESHG